VARLFLDKAGRRSPGTPRLRGPVGIEPTVKVAETVIVKVVRSSDPAKDKLIEA
jgi:hypothetical protein